MLEPLGSPLVPFPTTCTVARFKQRQKRFMVEVETEGESFWVHTNNSGSMLGLLQPGTPVLVSPSPNPKRKLPYTLEMVFTRGFWVGVNTSMPGRVLRAAWQEGLLTQAEGYPRFESEKKSAHSRLDARLHGPNGTLWVESKNVTLVEDDVAYFPDAVTTRGQKHLQELTALRASGVRCACFYLIQRPDSLCFAPADFIDPTFAELFWTACSAGVEMWVYEARLGVDGVSLGRRIPLKKPDRKTRSPL